MTLPCPGWWQLEDLLHNASHIGAIKLAMTRPSRQRTRSNERLRSQSSSRSLEKRMDEINENLKIICKQFENSDQRSSRSQSSKKRSDQRSSTRSKQRDDSLTKNHNSDVDRGGLCFYHLNFGSKARTCRSPCKNELDDFFTKKKRINGQDFPAQTNSAVTSITHRLFVL